MKSKGHYGGPIDGIIGSQTRRGVASYQASNGVDSDILTLDSAKKLGLI
ncbi:MAG: peptidoglycan-binding protein [Pikeienuella sp.]